MAEINLTQTEAERLMSMEKHRADEEHAYFPDKGQKATIPLQSPRMLENIERLLNDYHVWLKDKTHLRRVGEWVEITTPYLDRHNDYAQVYVKQNGDGFILTDDGYTLDDLEQTGCNLDSHKRKSLLQTTLNDFGVQLKGGALEVHASDENFALKKHNLAQAMLAVGDMFYLAAPAVTSMFYEDVAAWLELNEVRYTPKVKFTGKSGFDHLFDFVIPKSRRQPERILRTINRPNRDSAQSLVFAWTDTREARPPDSRAYAVLNDSDNAAPAGVSDALRNYDLRPVVWSMRDGVSGELAA